MMARTIMVIPAVIAKFESPIQSYMNYKCLSLGECTDAKGRDLKGKLVISGSRSRWDDTELEKLQMIHYFNKNMWRCPVFAEEQVKAFKKEKKEGKVGRYQEEIVGKDGYKKCEKRNCKKRINCDRRRDDVSRAYCEFRDVYMKAATKFCFLKNEARKEPKCAKYLQQLSEYTRKHKKMQCEEKTHKKKERATNKHTKKAHKKKERATKKHTIWNAADWE